MVQQYLWRYFNAVNKQMEITALGDQSIKECNHALDYLQEQYAQRIINGLYSNYAKTEQ
jgi:hypothetical protein